MWTRMSLALLLALVALQPAAGAERAPDAARDMPLPVGQDGRDGRVGVPAGPLVLGQGQASWYGNRFHGRLTASGERYDKNALTAAHKTLPFGTEVLVRSLQTGREVLVRIIDRGPHLKSRIIDLSHAAAEALGIRQHGVSEVQLIEP